MSHNVKLKDIQFTDLGVLEQAIRELVKDGAKVELLRGDQALMRGWAGATSKFDAVIKITNGPWDIGLTYNEATKSYDLTTESMMRPGTEGGLGAQGDAKQISGDFCRIDHNAQILGRLTQRYNIIRDERIASKAGMITRRIVAPNGIMQLEAQER